MRTNPVGNLSAFKQYYVQPGLYKADETKMIEDDISFDEVPLSDLNKVKQDFEIYALPHMQILFNYARKISANYSDADDLFQDTYLRAFRFFHNFEIGSNCKAWLFKIMKNCFINKYRKDKKNPQIVDYDEFQNFYDRNGYN